MVSLRAVEPGHAAGTARRPDPARPPRLRPGRRRARSVPRPARPTASRPRSRGASRARNAAGAAASRPKTRGSRRVWAPSAPSSVARFHSAKTDHPVAQKASRAERLSVRATAIAQDSSMTRCAASSRIGPRTRNRADKRSPYRALREPSSVAVAAAASGAPPAPSTPTSANWLAPVNMTADSVAVCGTDSPVAVAIAPKDSPYAPVAAPTARASRSTARRRSSQPGARASPGCPVVMVSSTQATLGAVLVDALDRAILRHLQDDGWLTTGWQRGRRPRPGAAVSFPVPAPGPLPRPSPTASVERAVAAPKYQVVGEQQGSRQPPHQVEGIHPAGHPRTRLRVPAHQLAAVGARELGLASLMGLHRRPVGQAGVRAAGR